MNNWVLGVWRVVVTAAVLVMLISHFEHKGSTQEFNDLMLNFAGSQSEMNGRQIQCCEKSSKSIMSNNQMIMDMSEAYYGSMREREDLVRLIELQLSQNRAAIKQLQDKH